MLNLFWASVFSFILSLCGNPFQIEGNLSDGVPHQIETENSVPSPATATGQAGQPSLELPPIRRVFLYNQGLATIEHRGHFQGSGKMSLPVSEFHLSDVLKSIVFLETGDGKVTQIKYRQSFEPVTPISPLGNAMTQAQLIQSLRGNQLTLETKQGKVAGIIYGVEQRQFGELREEVVVVITKTGLQSIKLNDLLRVDFAADIRQEMIEAMQQLAAARLAEDEPDDPVLEFLVEGADPTKQQTFAFAYVQSTPVWRMTYRLSIDDDNSINLQGWADVANQTMSDWDQVELILRTGQPLSIRIDLSRMVYSSRPQAGLEIFGLSGQRLSYSTPLYSKSTEAPPINFYGYGGPGGPGGMGGMGMGGMGMGGMGMGGMGGGLGGMEFGGGFADWQAEAEAFDDVLFDIRSTFQQLTTTGRADQSLELKLTTPVSLSAGEQAMVPAIITPLSGRRISSHKIGEPGIFRAVSVTNQTDLSLPAGPVAVYDARGFVGDSSLPRLASKAEHDLVYATDQALEILETSSETTRQAGSMGADHQHISISDIIQTTQSFKVTNHDIEDREFWLYYPLPDQHEFGQPQPNQLEDRTGRFEISLAPSTSVDQSIVLISTETRKIPFDATIEKLRSVLQEPVEIPAAIKQWIEQRLAIAESLRKIQDEKLKLSLRRDLQIREQKRMADNINVLGVDNQAAETLVARLLEIEQQLSEIQVEIAQVETAEALEKSKLNELFDNLPVE